MAKHLMAVMLCTSVIEAGDARKATLEPVAVPDAPPRQGAETHPGENDPNSSWSGRGSEKADAKFELTVGKHLAGGYFEEGKKYEVEFKPIEGNVTHP